MDLTQLADDDASAVKAMVRVVMRGVALHALISAPPLTMQVAGGGIDPESLAQLSGNIADAVVAEIESKT